MAGGPNHDDGTAANPSPPIPSVTLSTGRAMPVLGFGTGSSRAPPDLADTILHAVRLGYRHIDTASIYGTEPAVGAAVSEAVRSGAVGSRTDLFVTSKLWIFDARPSRVVPALRESLARLGLDYLDFFLVHWPVSSDGGAQVEFDMEGVWRGMEECHRLGLARSVGVSNFSAAKMERLMSIAAVPPAVNQVELNVGWRQEKVREVCARHGVLVSAYSPLGALGTVWGSDAVMESGVLHQVAAAKGKTVAQVALRWVYEQGVCFVARSFNRERLEQNMAIFSGWELSEVEKKMIATIFVLHNVVKGWVLKGKGFPRPLHQSMHAVSFISLFKRVCVTSQGSHEFDTSINQRKSTRRDIWCLINMSL